jgi:hypothetical protein
VKFLVKSWLRGNRTRSRKLTNASRMAAEVCRVEGREDESEDLERMCQGVSPNDPSFSRVGPRRGEMAKAPLQSCDSSSRPSFSRAKTTQYVFG